MELLCFDEVTRKNDVTAFKSLIKKDARVNEVSGDMNNTALHTAAWKGYTEMIKLLLDAGADVRCKNKKGFTPAHIAANYGRKDALEVLIQHDKSLLEEKDLMGNTVLHIGAWKGHKTVIQYLLKHNVDLHMRNNDGNTPYHLAVLWKRMHTLRLLLKHDKRAMENTNKAGFTPLHIAATKGYDEISACLLANGASIVKRNISGKTPVQLATPKSQKVFNKFKDYKRIVSSCASGMASLLSPKRYDDNDTALHIMAAFEGNQSYIHQLVQSGSSTHILNDYNKTPLFVAVNSGNASNVSALLCHTGKAVCVDEETGRTALHIAAQNNDLDCLQVLVVRHGDDVNVVDHSKETALTYMIKHQSREGVELILNNGGDATLKCRNENTSLHLSVVANNFDITANILRRNPELVNCQNCNGDTPLTFAVSGNSFALAQILIEHDADPDIKNNSGHSGRTLALTSKNDSMRSLFENIGGGLIDNERYSGGGRR